VYPLISRVEVPRKVESNPLHRYCLGPIPFSIVQTSLSPGIVTLAWGQNCWYPGWWKEREKPWSNNDNETTVLVGTNSNTIMIPWPQCSWSRTPNMLTSINTHTPLPNPPAELLSHATVCPSLHILFRSSRLRRINRSRSDSNSPWSELDSKGSSKSDGSTFASGIVKHTGWIFVCSDGGGIDDGWTSGHVRDGFFGEVDHLEDIGSEGGFDVFRLDKM
jgi:hypothetical protein